MARLVLLVFAVATVITSFWFYGIGFIRRMRGKLAASVQHSPGTEIPTSK